ncbi:hypothetical protein XH94_28845 [Bradyrhizobium zhanjiangense]|uniref:Uncharacterized protein n=1 Tax=Bradyrhizobium zhanjiangense TaxID=1325107 RepID=A0A4Q0SC01_9BRAD|nr:hypothetical protein XH94_28845 [Bradyrhizobium zhanjiangense]
MAASVVLVTGAAADCAGAVATGAVAAGAVVVVGVVVAVWIFAGGVAAGACGAADVTDGSAACWFGFVAAKLRLRDPPACTCVASSDIADQDQLAHGNPRHLVSPSYLIAPASA